MTDGPLGPSATIAVVGAGTMGAGIAQVAAVAGRPGCCRPLAWGQNWGPAVILAVLEAMQGWYGEERYRPSALLRRIVVAGGSLVPVTEEKS